MGPQRGTGSERSQNVPGGQTHACSVADHTLPPPHEGGVDVGVGVGDVGVGDACCTHVRPAAVNWIVIPEGHEQPPFAFRKAGAMHGVTHAGPLASRTNVFPDGHTQRPLASRICPGYGQGSVEVVPVEVVDETHLASAALHTMPLGQLTPPDSVMPSPASAVIRRPITPPRAWAAGAS
jgi:hypothetical protein